MASKFGHTFSPGQSPLHEMTLQMASSIHCQDEISYKIYQPTAASYGGTSAYDQLPFHVSSCIRMITTQASKLPKKENFQYLANQWRESTFIYREQNRQVDQ